MHGTSADIKKMHDEYKNVTPVKKAPAKKRAAKK